MEYSATASSIWASELSDASHGVGILLASELLSLLRILLLSFRRPYQVAYHA